MNNYDDDESARLNLAAFQKGVVEALDRLDPERSREYDSLFWGNVTGHEFESPEDAFSNGQEVAEASADQEAAEIPCDCGNPTASWHGSPVGLRAYMCDICWDVYLEAHPAIREAQEVGACI